MTDDDHIGKRIKLNKVIEEFRLNFGKIGDLINFVSFLTTFIASNNVWAAQS